VKTLPSDRATVQAQAQAATLHAVAAHIDAAAATLARAGLAPAPAVVVAAKALAARSAVALPGADERTLALALVAAAWSAEWRPVHLVAADDDAAQALVQRLARCWPVLGLDATALEVTTLRRLAANRCRAEQALRRPDSPAVPLPPAQALLIDDLDRVLVDEAQSSITLAVADDATGLVEALAVARTLALALRPGEDTASHFEGLEPDTLEQAEITAQASRLPPVWRSRERRERLLQQAWLVRRLQRGRDYEVSLPAAASAAAPGGAGAQVLFDDRLIERLPDRGLVQGLTQALQLHLGLPPSPVARTLARVHVDRLLAAYPRLAGVAPSLHGLRHELWRRHRLKVVDDPAPPAALPLAWCADADAAETAIHDWLTSPGATTARLLVLRRPQALLHWGPRVAALRAAGAAVAVAVDTPSSPLPPAVALAELPGQQPLALLFAEPLESARAQRAWQRRAADHPAGLASAVQLLAPPLALLRDHMPALAATWPLLDRLLPPRSALRAAAHRALLHLARAVAGWRGARLRRQLGEREQRLAQQLSFTTGQRSAAPVPPHRPDGPGVTEAEPGRPTPRHPPDRHPSPAT
jgi:hypothetical protein